MPKITKQLIDSTNPTTDKDIWIWDTEVQGFGVRVRSGGRKTYMVRYRTKDAARLQRKMVLCRCSDAPPDKARGMAREVFTAVARGEDPVAARAPSTVKLPTIEEMFQGYVASLRDQGKVSADNVERALLLSKKNPADYFGRKRAPSEITAEEVVNYVASFYREGLRGSADKARGYLHAAYAWAIHSTNDYRQIVRRNWHVTRNPAADVAKDHGAIGVRDRNLDAAEIKLLWTACDEHTTGFTEGTEVCIRMMIACGQRVQETLRLCGSELDLDKAVWKMPAIKTKGKKRDHEIPLPAIIIPYLRALKKKHGDGTLFPGRSDSAKETIGSLSVAHAVKRWIDMPGTEIDAFQTRDLRRTWKSRTHDAGIDRFTRDLIQQHAKNDTGSKNYDRADYLPQMTEAMDKWSAWLTAAIYGPPKLKLVA